MAEHPHDALAVFVTLTHDVDTVLSSKADPFCALGKLQLSRVINQSPCSFPGGGFTSKRGSFGSAGKLETMMCVSYGRMEDLVFSGAATGDIFIWKDVLLLKTVKAHDGPVFAMYALDKVWYVRQVLFFICFRTTEMPGSKNSPCSVRKFSERTNQGIIRKRNAVL